MAAPLRQDPSRNAARRRALLASTSLLAAFAAAVASAQQLPTGGSVASGAASIGQSGSAMTINQTSQRAVINWNGFSIGAGASVTFAQPDAGSATLNRVTGASQSTISGLLSANGQVYLVNPNGVLITRSGAVNTGSGFIASTLGLTDRDFNDGKLNFKGGGRSAAVVNEGTITTGPGGFVGLLGGAVSNSGVINAPLGKVALGSGEQATLDFDGDGFLQVALPTDAKSADGKALIDVAGTVKAGSVAIKAATAANAVRNAINLSGYVSARSAKKIGGSIILGGGDGGDVKVSGKLDASGRARAGSISVTGHDVALTQAKLRARSAGGAGGSVAVTGTGAVKLARANIDASGATAGGSISVGGGARGLGPLQHAASTKVEASTLRADAMLSGPGGAISIWSDGLTTVSSLLTARGGAEGGDGGTIETSGKKVHLVGSEVDASAAHGAAGLWLIDPVDFVIAPSGGDATGLQISTTLNNGTNVTHSNSEGAGGTAGDVVVKDTISWSSGATLTLSAFHDIVISQNMSVTGAGAVAFNTGVGNTVPGHVLFALSDTGPTASLTFGAAGSLKINGNSYQLLRTEADLASITLGPSARYALANDITVATPVTRSLAATFTGALEGLGNNLVGLTVNQGVAATNVGLFGTLGAGGVVSNLFLSGATINGGTANNVGAIAAVNAGEIYNSGASGAVNGSGANMGGLVGFNQRLVDRGFSSVNVNGTQILGNDNIGGLVGANAGGINSGGVIESFASGDVTGNSAVGGLVGLNSGYVNGGSSGNVVGNANVGGVVGQNNAPDGDDFVVGSVNYGHNGTVAGAYFFGFAFGTQFAGGVVGLNSGTVDSSKSTGVVQGNFAVGGLVGENDGAIVDSYATGAVTGNQSGAEPAPQNLGGLVGIESGTIDSAFALGAVTGGPNGTNVGGLVGVVNLRGSTPTIQNAYATGRVSGASGLGGFIGALGGSTFVTVTNGYYDTQTTGQGNVVGAATGLTTAQLQGGTTGIFGGTSNFTGGAAGGVAGVYPYLSTLFQNGAHVVSGFAYSNLGVTPLVSGTGGPVTVVVDTPLSPRNEATTGANGYYYSLIDANDLPSGANVLVYTNVPGSAGATYFVSNGAANTPALLADVHGTLLSVTTPATTTTYSQVVAGINSAIAGDATNALGVINGVANINIQTNSPAFNVDAPITPQANVTLNAGATGAVTISSAQTTNSFTLNAGSAVVNAPVSGTAVVFNTPTTLSADVTGTSLLDFFRPVTLGASVTLTSPSIGLFSVSSTIPGVGLTTSGAAVQLGGNVTTNNGPITFGGAVTLLDNVVIDSGTAATTTFAATVDSSGDTFSNFFGLTVNARSISFGGSIGDFALGPVLLTSVAPLTIPATFAQSLIARTTGAGSGLTLNGVLSLTGSGTVATLVSAGAFTNNVGAGAIPLTTGQQWQIFITSPVGNNYNGLDSGNFAIWGRSYAGANVPVTGNSYVFAFQPTLTFTSTNDAKTYGQDVTTRVANDFTVSGLQPGVNRAYLPDTIDRALSGAPSVTSAGSAAGASVAGSPYAIDVAQGTLTALDGYALAFASTGQLTVNRAAITLTATANTKVYDSTIAAAATPTLTAGALFDTATLAETYATPNAGTGITLNPTIAFANPAAANNYTITLAPVATGVITPEPITITARPFTKVFDGTTFSEAAPNLTSGALFDAATLSQRFASANPGAAINLIPSIAFANAGAANNYAITLVPTGVIPPNTGVILAQQIPVNLSPSVFVDEPPALGIPDFASTCAVSPQLPDPASFSDPAAAIQAISAAASQYVERCRDASQQDIGNALDAYADALEVVIQKLPAKLRVQLQHIPRLVHAAAQRARVAPTRAAAVRVLRATVVAVQREIALVRADDPDSARIRAAVGAGVSGVLNTAALSLARAEGI